jgi:carbamoyl-phosphate synthase large subunit
MPKRTDIHSVLIIGAGPIIIGQACEFDYSGTQACKALREEGYRIILVNSNPATIMTDPEFADRTYIEPITPECMEKIIAREDGGNEAHGRQGKLVLLPTLGGPNRPQHRHGPASARHPGAIRHRDDRRQRQPPSNAAKTARFSRTDAFDRPGRSHQRHGATPGRARAVAEKIGRFPLIIRPAYTLGGTGGGIAYNREEFDVMARRGLELSPVSEILIEESLLGWKEFEMEVMRDNDNCVIICSIENFDPMGVHTGDSITVAPASRR